MNLLATGAKTAKDVTSFIGYNRMCEDGICEVEEECSPPASVSRTLLTILFARMLESCIYVDRRLYDQFGADTLVQFNIINTAAQGTDWTSKVLQSVQPTECKRRKRCRRLQ